MQRATKHLLSLVMLSLVFALSACGGGGSSATAGAASVTGVSTPSSVSVVTATHQAN